MTKKMICISMGVLLYFMTGAASAAPIHYDFEATPDNNTHDSLHMTVDGVALTITAWAKNSENSWLQVTSAYGNYGGDNAGVYNGTYGLGLFLANSDDSYSMDGADGANDGVDRDEGLLFSFDRQVELTHINFRYWGSNDDFNLDADGISLFVDNANSGNDNYYGSHVGTKFMVWADGDNDSFRIQDIDINTVPEPSTLLLLVSGLVGLAGTRRRFRELEFKHGTGSINAVP